MITRKQIRDRLSKIEGRNGPNTGVVIIYHNQADYERQVSKQPPGRVIIGIPYNGRDPL